MKYLFWSLISGLLLSISWPTYGIPFFIFFALVPLLLAEQDLTKFSRFKRKSWMVFGLAYLTFFIWNIVTTGWLYGAKNPDGSHSLMAAAFPVLVNSLLYTIVFMLYHWYKKIQGTYWGLVFFVAIWMGFEKLHLNWEFTWPWLNLGNSFSEYPKLIQWYDTLGSTGGSFWILTINVFAFYTLRIWSAGRKKKSLVTNLTVLIALIAIPMIISVIKYNSFNEKPIGEVTTLLLQPDLDPYTEKYSKQGFEIVQDFLQLAEDFKGEKIDFYITPETSFPGYGAINEDQLQSNIYIDSIKTFLINHPQSVFVGGVSTYKDYPNQATKTARKYQNVNFWRDDFNSAIQITTSANEKVYHKAKFVPGVEIFPYQNLLKPILGDAMLNFGGTVVSLGSDNERKVFTNTYNKGKIAPIICYESIYGEFVTDYVKNGANFLAIMTNDSWWGISEGHRQLISYARLRAIETRREIARSANSGISAHINAKGEIIEDTIYGDKTALFAKIKLYEGETFYTKTGDLLTRISIFILGFLVFYTLIKQVQKRIKK